MDLLSGRNAQQSPGRQIAKFYKHTRSLNNVNRPDSYFCPFFRNFAHQWSLAATSAGTTAYVSGSRVQVPRPWVRLRSTVV